MPMVQVRALSWLDLQLLSDVLRKIGHDLNNAMVPALGLSDMMRNRHRETPAARDIERLHQRLDRLRDASSMAVAHTLRGSRAVDRPLAGVVKELQAAADHDDVRLQWHLPEEPSRWPLPGLDANLSRLMLRALVVNAIQAHADAPNRSGTNRASINVHLRGPEDGWASRLIVLDNGPGCEDLSDVAQGTARRGVPSRLGVGLIVASSLAARGGGILEIGPATGGGFLAQATWPSTATDAS